ncbi:ester cyclase [Chloroflexota bacterium]
MIKDYVAAWNSHDTEKIASFFTEDGVHEDVAIGSVYHGRNELKAGLAPFFNAFPDFKLEIKSLFNTTESVAQEWLMTGTQTGALDGLGIPATGKSFSIRGASITNLHGGKIARNTDGVQHI